jgi:hypothetical protein
MILIYKSQGRLFKGFLYMIYIYIGNLYLFFVTCKYAKKNFKKKFNKKT